MITTIKLDSKELIDEVNSRQKQNIALAVKIDFFGVVDAVLPVDHEDLNEKLIVNMQSKDGTWFTGKIIGLSTCTIVDCEYEIKENYRN